MPSPLEVGSTVPPALSPKRVLIAEDNTDLRIIFAKVFERSGFQVEVANDGQVAVASLMQSMPDVLVLDINMPNVSGIDVLTYVRRTQGERHVSVIVVTGNSQVEQNPEIELADLFMLKPVDVPSLVTLAQRLMSGGII